MSASAPLPSDVHLNAMMTAVSIAYIQSSDAFIAGRIFPRVPVQKQSDRYYTYPKGDFFRAEMQIRAPGTESEGSSYRLDNSPSYYCDEWSLHKDIPDQVRANADAAINPDREATIYLTQQGLLRREKQFVAKYFQPSVWGTDIAGVASAPGAGQALRWDDAASTPIEDIRRAKTAVLQATGFEPNKLTLGRPVYDKLADHPDIIDRLKYGQTGPNPAQVSKQKLAALFEVDEVVVANAVENTAARGLTDSMSFIAGKHALLSYAPSNPGLMTPSAGYVFTWTGMYGAQAEGTRITNFRMPQLKSERFEIDMSFDMKVVASDLGYFFNGIVA